ncbi:hypothetical protein BOTBODRAFT_46195 [Botryobasidium botryosum FD-172 SS1]|uniref:Uncharacterized protein n=1 Tax=Botryobasidium botryosum (strain FD-172 SS1) TaxID=930990 RepID=A0A067MAQ8_BOTB1|nr:hypothetical protein BOTBODRAFT_46195 [Botryobasidium botryosum FD-172 SS1]
MTERAFFQFFAQLLFQLFSLRNLGVGFRISGSILGVLCFGSDSIEISIIGVEALSREWAENLQLEMLSDWAVWACWKSRDRGRFAILISGPPRWMAHYIPFLPAGNSVKYFWRKSKAR